MNRIILLAIIIMLVATAAVDARIKVMGRGADMNFDAGSIPANLQAAYNLMSKKCVKCHSMERTVIAIQTGKAPVTGQPFDKQAIKAYGIKMLRKPNSDMNKQEIRDVVMLLNYLLDESRKN